MPPIADDPPPIRVAETTVPDEDVDLVSGLLWAAGVSAVAEHDAGPGRTLLRTDLPPGGADALRTWVGHFGDVQEATLANDGLDAWRDHAEVVVAGDHLVVRPPWVPFDGVDLPVDPMVLEIDPGRSWGHGAHSTTRLCLVEVERACRDRVGMTVLDLGCGSGVLGIAAARLGATSVLAVDVDAVAVAATTANASLNDVGDRVRAVHATDADDPMRGLDGRYDLVVANIGAATLTSLASDILVHVADDGLLVVTGLLDPVDDAVGEAFLPWRVIRTEVLDGWTALILRSDQVNSPRIVGGR